MAGAQVQCRGDLVVVPDQEGKRVCEWNGNSERVTVPAQTSDSHDGGGYCGLERRERERRRDQTGKSSQNRTEQKSQRACWGRGRDVCRHLRCGTLGRMLRPKGAGAGRSSQGPGACGWLPGHARPVPRGWQGAALARPRAVWLGVKLRMLLLFISGRLAVEGARGLGHTVDALRARLSRMLACTAQRGRLCPE